MNTTDPRPNRDASPELCSSELLAARRIEGIEARKDAAGYGWCLRCGRPWTICKGHSTEFRDGIGCFPLCDECWAELAPETRLPYYRQMWNEWEIMAGAVHYEWQDIEEAVMKGG